MLDSTNTQPAVLRAPRYHLRVADHVLYPFTIECASSFTEYVRHIETPLSDYTFANNYLWLSQASGFYQIINDCFCLFCLTGDSLTMLLPPLGPVHCQHEALLICFELMDHYNPQPGFSKVEYVYADFLERVYPGFETNAALSPWICERTWPDYIYRTDDLIDLKGNNYKTKRNEINRFLRSYPNHRVEPLLASHWPGVEELLATWIERRMKCLSASQIRHAMISMDAERRAIERAFGKFDRMGLDGLSLFIDDRLAGFTFGERIGAKVASVLVEKTDFAIDGAAQFLFREFARLFADTEYINVGDDLGMENLRQVKMSYRPILFGEKIIVRREVGPSEARIVPFLVA